MGKINCFAPLLRVAYILSKEGVFPDETLVMSVVVAKVTLHIIVFGTGMFFLILNGINAVKTGNDADLVQSTCVLIPIMNLFVKLIILLRKKKYFVSLLEYVNSETFNDHSVKLNGYIKLVYRISGLLWKFYTFSITAYVSILAILPFAINSKLMIPPPFEMGRYLLVYKLLHFGLCFYLAVNSICLDVLYISLLALCIAQLYILENRLMHVFEEAKEMCRNDNLEEIQLHEENILKSCIVLHETLNQYVEKLSVILSLPLFVQYFCGCFIICNFILQLTIMGERNPSHIITITAYAVITFSQMTAYHWLGNEIIFKSANIINACYLSNWYKLNRKSKKLLIILMERAKRPLVIEVYKIIHISLESLGQVLKWSYSLFALIQARYN